MSTLGRMAMLRLFRGSTARAFATKAIAALVLLQLLVLALPVGAAPGTFARGASVCHTAKASPEAPPQPAPASHHCAFCPCLHSVETFPATVVIVDALAPFAPAAAAGSPERDGPPPPAGRAVAWSSRAPPRG